ncbi:hypothetical protein [Pseudomonas alloputida]|uniref:hypothetical protein n=1 Tax=Pseudomonas TaxID=286 RepID=UPI003EEC7DE3
MAQAAGVRRDLQVRLQCGAYGLLQVGRLAQQGSQLPGSWGQGLPSGYKQVAHTWQLMVVADTAGQVERFEGDGKGCF